MRDMEGLHRFLAERQSMPFAWGDHANDCFSLPAAGIVAQGGPDFLADRHWSSEQEAYAVLDDAGGFDAAVSTVLAPIEPAFAKRGDVGAIEVGNHLILVTVEGDTLVGPGPKGLRRLPRRLMVKAWTWP